MPDDPRHPHVSSGYTFTGDAAVSTPEGGQDLASLKVDELRALADERGIDHDGLKKAELVEALGG